ncbi:MAG TPA: oligoendopeptidase F [Usitatibacter sp.]|nr:oligoendopeptidase F [Usitatibacter sp.]
MTILAGAAVSFAAAAQQAAPAQQYPERPQDRWALADLYATTAAWNEDFARAEQQVGQFASCKGQLGSSASRLRECMELQDDATKRFLRLLVYAYELQSEDTGVSSSLELRQRVTVLGAKFTEATSFVRPEVLAVGQAKIDQFLREEPKLATYRHPLRDILRAAPHTLDDAGESLVASFALSSGAADSTFEILTNADMPWNTVKLADGKEVKVDESAYSHYRETENRDDRRRIHEALFGKFKEFERTLGVMYYANLKEDTVYAKVRKYPDSFARAMDANNLPLAVYDTLVKSANETLPTLHRYFKLRGRILGIPDMRYYDISPPLVKGGDRRFPIDEGIQIMLESAKPLGDDYVRAMAAGIKARWMDVYPRPRKLSGAHAFGAAYDVHPFVMMNYTENYSSVSTLAHEWGHAMHSHLSNKAQPFATASYATFVAEIASTTNEAFLLEHMLKIAKTDDERMLYLGSALENLRGTFYRQVMLAEFEREAHARVDKGEAMTGEKFTKIYADIIRRYHGDKEGVVKIDDLYTIDWGRIPHFYRSFYVFQYATSIAAGSLFAERILKGEPGARERYVKLLSSGGSDYPYELVKAAGVDLASPEPYRALARQMDRIMDRIEEILARRGK